MEYTITGKSSHSYWPVQQILGADRYTKIAAPSNHQSHYVTGFIATAAAAKSFYFPRRTCMKFTAANNVVTVADDTALEPTSGDFLLSIWIKTSSHTLVDFVSKIDGTNGYTLETTAAGLVKVSVGDAGAAIALTGVTPINDGLWHNIMVVGDISEKAGLYLYVDNKLDVRANGTTEDYTGIAPITGGAIALLLSGTAAKTFYLSNFALFKGSSWTTAEITAIRTSLYNKTGSVVIGKKLEGDETDLAVGLPLDEGTGTVNYDVAGTNDSTFANAAFAAGGIPIDPADPNDDLGVFGPILVGTNETAGLYTCTFPHAMKIGCNNPLIVVGDGAITLQIFGETSFA